MIGGYSDALDIIKELLNISVTAELNIIEI
jgi:hypothetical protein